MRLGGELRLRLEHQASCVTCGRNVGNKGDDAVTALLFGTADIYQVCPSCLQFPSDARDEDYRRRARVVLFERHRIVVRDGVPYRAATACPSCGGELQRTRMGVAPAGSEWPGREADVLSCTGCEYVEEEA